VPHEVAAAEVLVHVLPRVDVDVAPALVHVAVEVELDPGPEAPAERNLVNTKLLRYLE
jgi:hypothetical protein